MNDQEKDNDQRRIEKKEMIVDRGWSKSWNQGELGINGEIYLCQEAKLRGIDDQESVHAFFGFWE